VPANPLAPFVANWQKRLAQAQAAGIPESALAPVFKMDLQRLQQGTTPLTNEEAGVALAAAAGAPKIQNTGPSKPDWNPLHLIGRAGQDIGSIAKGRITLPSQMAKDVSHIGDMPAAIGKGIGDIGSGKVGQGLQEIAGAPGLNELLLAGSFLIPGGEVADPALLAAEGAGEAAGATAEAAGAVGTATKTLADTGLKGMFNKAVAGELAAGEVGKVLTPQGRKDISQHPLQNLLQVTPLASEANLVGRLSDTAAAEAIKTSKAAGVVTDLRNSLGITDAYRQMWRQFSDARKVAHDFMGTTHDASLALFKQYADDPQAMTEIKAAMQSGDPAVLQATEAKYPGFGDIKNRWDEIQSKLSEGPELVHLVNPTTGIPDVWTSNSLPAKADSVLTKEKDRLARHTDSVTSASRDAAAAKIELQHAGIDPAKGPQQILDQVKKLGDQDFSQNGAQGRLVQMTDAVTRRINSGDFAGAAAMLRSVAPDVADKLSTLQDYTDANAKVGTASLKANEAKARVTRAETAFRKAIDSRPAARWHQNIADEFHTQVSNWIARMYSGDPKMMQEATDQIGRRYYDASFDNGKRIVPEAELSAMMKESAAQVAKWQQEGWNPSFVHTVNEGQWQSLKYPSVSPRIAPKITSYQDKLLDRAPSQEGPNIAVSLTHQQAEVFLRQQWTDITQGYTDSAGKHQPGIFEVWGKPYNQLVNDLMRRDKTLSVSQAREQIDSEWVSPSKFGAKTRGDNVRIPKHLAVNLDRLNPEKTPLAGLQKVAGKYTRGYRFAVTGLSPQHVVHIAASGAVMFGAAMSDLPTVLRSVGEARRMIKDGTVPVRLTQEASMLPEEEAMAFGMAEKSRVRVYVDTVTQGMTKAVTPLQKVNAAMNHFDEHLTQWYKTLDYVSQTKRGLDPEQALLEVGKHFADHAGRSPMERALFKSIVPFGSWTEHLLRYTFRYPIDHPVRAGIIANLATAEFEDQFSGLPKNFAQLFFVGDKAFDIRSFNPFRDLGNDLRLGGFLSTLNPAAEAIFKTIGYNPVTDSAELYPELQVDPNTGKLVTKGGNFWRNVAETSLPQLTGIEGLLGWNDQLRQLKKTNPSAFNYTLGRMLHVPWVPQKIDIPTERAKEQLNQMKVAQAAVSSAMKTGDFSTVDQFSEVPFQGQLVPPSVLQSLYQLLQSKNTGFTPNTLLRK